MLKGRRRILRVGDSVGITIPAGLERAEIGEDATLAANRIILVDPRGKIEQGARAADAIEGWYGTVARFLVVFLPATGLRPKEIRLAWWQDLDVER